MFCLDISIKFLKEVYDSTLAKNIFLHIFSQLKNYAYNMSLQIALILLGYNFVSDYLLA